MSRRFTDTSSAEAIIEGIKAGEYKNTLTIIGLLKQIINDLPETSVAKEATDLLDDYTWTIRGRFETQGDVFLHPINPTTKT